MNLCSYGCGNEGIYLLKNGNYCCSCNWASCPSIKKKNSESCKKKKQYNFSHGKNPNLIRVNCKFCNMNLPFPRLKPHERGCYLNPNNLRYCYCGNVIKERRSKTCSHSCGNKLFKQNQKTDEECSKSSLSIRICFRHHKHKCIVCEEKNIVEVHHLDNNHNNNDEKNLIPLCSTHHRYVHSRFKELIIDKIKQYIRERWEL